MSAYLKKEYDNLVEKCVNFYDLNFAILQSLYYIF